VTAAAAPPAPPPRTPPTPPTPRTPTRRDVAGLVAIGVAAGLLGGGIAGFAVSRSGTTAGGTCNAVRVADAALPAVVTVLAEGPTGSGSGSGAIISRDGEIVTNDHVISGAAPGGIRVLLNSGELKEATLVGTDPRTDLAVLRIEATGLPTLAIGDDSALRVGEQVVALGAPLGLTGTVTSGIVSALDRDVLAPVAGGGSTVLAGSIQTDASINPGNSGGPLVDCAGRLVGLNTVISTVPNDQGVAGGGSVGLGFAVPARIVGRISDELLANGRATHASLGLALAEVPPAVAAAFGVEAGMYVQAVAPAGPSARAGVRPGDLIVTIAGTPANSFTVGRLLATAQVGDSVELALARPGQRLTVTVVLEEAS